tara:strand:- start:989 stop:1942 length:954 start_codon:yes stop_codon:yes gene_type:complete
MSMGNIFRWFFGTAVETNTDPVGERIKVRCDGVHGDEISDADLPYAQVILPTTGGGTSGIGENQQVLPGARVTGFFIDGDLCQLPIVIGILPHVAKPPENKVDDGSDPVLTSIRPSTRVFQSENNTITEAVRATSSPTLDERKKICWEFFSKKSSIYTPQRIAGIIGNLIVESNIDPKKHQDVKVIGDGKGSGRGIAQWGSKSDGNRWQDCIAFARSMGVSEYGLVLQLQFIHHELQTKPYHCRNFYKTVSVAAATMSFCRHYEGPRDEGTPNNTTISVNENTEDTWKGGNPWNTKEGEQERLKNAEAAYREFTESP